MHIFVVLYSCFSVYGQHDYDVGWTGGSHVDVVSCGSGVCWATGGADISVEVLDVGVVQLQMKKITYMLLMFDFIDYCNLYHVCVHVLFY